MLTHVYTNILGSFRCELEALRGIALLASIMDETSAEYRFSPQDHQLWAVRVFLPPHHRLDALALFFVAQVSGVRLLSISSRTSCATMIRALYALCALLSAPSIGPGLCIKLEVNF